MQQMRELAVGLYGALREQPGNLFLSPYSVWVALAMLFPGARGETREQLGGLLGIDGLEPVRDVRTALASRAEPTRWQRDALAYSDGGDGGYGFHLDVANKLWVQRGYPIAADYAAALADSFGVDPAPVDFAGAIEAACAAINRWVKDATRGKIGAIVDPRTLAPLTRAVLANAVYFKAAWDSEFMEARTRPRPFHRLDGSRIDTPTMARTGYYGHAEVDGVIAVELDYIRPELKLDILMPRQDFPRAEAGLTPAFVDRAVDALEPTLVALELPRFRFESVFDLGQPLAALGIAALFDDRADLSGVSDEPGFHVDSVIHKTFVDVNERGTEAAAVTAIAVAGAGPMAQPEPIAVSIDRPFFLLIRDVPTGIPLFFGRVVDPST